MVASGTESPTMEVGKAMENIATVILQQRWLTELLNTVCPS